MTSYPQTLTVKKLIKMGFFIVKIYYISSSNDPDITHTKIIFGVSPTLSIRVKPWVGSVFKAGLVLRLKFNLLF